MPEDQEKPDTGSDADMGSTSDGEDQQAASNAVESADTGDSSEGEDLKTELDKWKAWARRHEEKSQGADKAREERDKAREELNELREQVKDRDELREQVESRDNQLTTAQQNLAAEQLHTRLARAGLSSEDATAVIEHIDPSRLIEDGAPSPSAIESVAASLSRTVSRGVDEDQGQSSPTPAVAADQWLRAKARK